MVHPPPIPDTCWVNFYPEGKKEEIDSIKKALFSPWGKTILLYLSALGINALKTVFTIPMKPLETALSASAMGRSATPYLSYLETWAAFLLVFLVIYLATKGRNNQFAMLAPARKGNTSLLVLHTDSLRIAFGFHAAWNFSQAILLGLPNTGIVSEITLFGLTQAPKNSLIYSSTWGIEAALPSALFFLGGTLLLILIFRKREATA